MIGISYGILVCNEVLELKRLISTLEPYIRPEDEIVILVDEQKAPEDLWTYLYSEDHWKGRLQVHRGQFTGDFSEWRNLLASFCTKDWIFQIDADEFVSPYLINDLPSILDSEVNGGVEMDGLLVPRMNTVRGLTEEDIQRWNWHVEPNGRVNWPDLQTRIYKNDGRIHYVGKVHERLAPVEIGTEIKFSKVPSQLQNTWVLFHPKTVDRQREQNELYRKLCLG